MQKFLCSVLVTFLASSSALADDVIVSRPPESIAKWYQPTNDRQIWLHNMFGLRRDMQAIRTYMAAKNQKLAAKWVQSFSEHYRKIGEMVPEWADELELGAVEQLEIAAAAGDFAAMDQVLPKIGQSCAGCHKEFRAVTAILYRTPDYRAIKLPAQKGEALDFREFMGVLQQQVNAVSIAMQDDRMKDAASAATDLKQGLQALKTSCSSCHKEVRQSEYFLGEQTAKAMQTLEESIQAGDKKAAGLALGDTALNACAHCHGVHRASYDLKRLISQ